MSDEEFDKYANALERANARMEAARERAEFDTWNRQMHQMKSNQAMINNQISAMTNTAGITGGLLGAYGSHTNPQWGNVTVPTKTVPARENNTAANFAIMVARQMAAKSLITQLREWRRDPDSKVDVAFLDQMLDSLYDLLAKPIEV